MSKADFGTPTQAATLLITLVLVNVLALIIATLIIYGVIDLRGWLGV